uniref:Uncharacterized protein n=1 Tax=Ascaris lumbricoides TaxID=6252 RepID=A0A0M3HJJ2_ASCLU
MAPRMRSCRKGTKFGKLLSNLNRPIKRPHRLQRSMFSLHFFCFFCCDSRVSLRGLFYFHFLCL